MNFRFLFLCILLLLAPYIHSQSETNDPKATAILDKVKERFNSLPQFEMSYQLKLQFPEQPEEIQKGSILKKGTSFRVINEMQTIVCDGKTLWVHLKDIEEIQIMDATDESLAGMLDPETFLSEFVDGQFIYGLTYDGSEGGKNVQKIEFKPMDPTSEYSKLRLTLDKSRNDILSLESFQKDGSRYTIIFNTLNPQPVVSADAFRFDPKKFPGTHVEDLRM
jgi:outer membrane lipoprotein-sorting protein